MTMNMRRGLTRVGPPEGKSEKDFVRAFRRKPNEIQFHVGGYRELIWYTDHLGQPQRLDVIFDAGRRFVRISYRVGC
jgi:hypothetical protein